MNRFLAKPRLIKRDCAPMRVASSSARPMRLIVALAAFAALSACESTQQPRQPTQSPIPVVDTAPRDPASLMALASRSRDSARAQLYLDAALAYEQLGAAAETGSAFAQIDARWLPVSSNTDYDLLRVRELFRAGDVRGATDLLNSVQTRLAGATNTPHRLALERTYIEYDRANGNFISAANRLMRMPAPPVYAADSAVGAGYDAGAALWQLISQASSAQASTAARTAAEQGNTVAEGWWLLAESLTGAFGERDARSRFLRWRQDYRNHPAAALPPPALRTLVDSPTRSQHIAVFLPLSGRLASAGNAVRDGIAAAYLDHRIALAGGSNASTELRFYDTAEDDMPSLLDNALAAGSTGIIGPLARDKVEELIALRPEIPAVALNYVERSPSPTSLAPSDQPTQAGVAVRQSEPTSQPEAIEQFEPTEGGRPSSDFSTSRQPTARTRSEAAPVLQLALAVEDEASEIARQLRRDGHERIAVLHANASWAERATSTLAAAWGASAAELMEARSLGSVQELTEQVGDVMLVSASEGRHQQLARALGLEVEFQPRARDDLDAVVALLDGRQAKALRPALRFHFAGDLPVYAASRARRGLRQADLADLNGVQIVQSAWDLGQTPLSSELNEALGSLPASLVALQALGVDALRIATQIDWLAAHPRTLEGSSGTLVTRRQQVRRQPGWAIVSSGELVPIPQVAAGQ